MDSSVTKVMGEMAKPHKVALEKEAARCASREWGTRASHRSIVLSGVNVETRIREEHDLGEKR